jgi:alanyl aminopeptidase
MHQRLLIGLLATLLALAGCGQENKQQAHVRGVTVPTEAVPRGPLARDVVPSRYRIALTVDPTKDMFSGHVEIDVTFNEKRRALYIHGHDLNVLAASVRLNAKHSIPAHYMQVDRSGVARLIFVDEVPVGKATLVFDYEASYGKSLSGLYKVVDRGDAYAFTQFESTSAREAFPSFDEPSFKAQFQLGVTAPASDKVVSNTPIQSVTRGQNGMASTLFQWTKPLPTYLVALAVGPLDIVDGGDIPANQYRSRPIHLRGVTARGNGNRIRYALSLTPKIVTALENYFGIAYPFPKLDVLAVPDFAAGAMENAGAVTFRERLLLLNPDATIDQKRATLLVQAHELTHQWFGDLVTPAWWDDIWLNESFANWMGHKASQAVLPDEAFDTETLRAGLDVMDMDELAAAPAIHRTIRTTDDIESAFGGIVYDKGAAVLSMFEGFVGEDVFRKGVRAYLSKFAWRNAAERDFIGTIAATAASQPSAKPENVAIAIDTKGAITWNGHNVAGMGALMDQLSHMSGATSREELTAAFDSFVMQPGVPELHMALRCDGAAAAHVTQSVYSPIGQHGAAHQWKVPACLGVAGSEKYCRLVDRRATDVFLGAHCPAALMPNDEGRGYYRFAVDEASRTSLIREAATLDAADQIALLYNLSSAVRSGEANASYLFRAIKNVAPGARWDVLNAIDAILQNLRVQSGIAGADLDDYRAFVRSAFASRMASVGLEPRHNEAATVSLTREQLATLLVSEGRDPQTVASLAAAAQSKLSGAPNILAPELVGEAMRAGLLAQGPGFANLMIKTYLTTDDEALRRQIVYAFAISDMPGPVNQLLALAVTPKMRTGELRYLYELLPEENVARSTLWSWYKQNYAKLLARVSRGGMRRPASTLRTACDVASRDDADGFFRPKLSELIGVDAALTLTEQQITRCIAFRQAKGAEIASALRTPSP